MNLKNIVKAFLFPHLAVLTILFPAAAVMLVYSLVFAGSKSPVAYVSYALASYILTILCARAPRLAEHLKKFKEENKYVRRWLTDTHFRVNVSLYSALLWNTAYAVFQLGLGLWHHSFWYYSLAGYYLCLAVMRFFLVRHTVRHKPGERAKDELIKYRTCGIMFLVMNLALSIIIFFMVYFNRAFRHHEITTIAMATYTFTSMAASIINVVKYRKYGSPVYSASKAISLSAACVSMITLESTMLTAFSDGKMTMASRRFMLGTSGAVVSVFIIGMALYMIVHSCNRLKLLCELKEEANG